MESPRATQTNMVMVLATHEGILSDLEGVAIKRFKNGFGLGFVESWIQQVNDDQGAPAVLNGFLGRAFGIGPIVTYSTKLGKSHLDFSARWIHDFDVSNRVAGTDSTSARVQNSDSSP